MTVMIRDHASRINYVTAITTGVPPGVQDADLLVLVLGFRERLSITSTSPMPPVGWALVGSYAGSQRPPVKSYIYQRIASSEPSSYTVHLDDTTTYIGDIGATILAFADCDTSAGVAQLAFASSEDCKHSIAAPSVTTTVDGALIVRVLQIADNTLDQESTPTYQTTWFTNDPVGPWVHRVYYQEQASAGATGTSTLAIHSNAYDLLNAITFTVNPAASGKGVLRESGG